MVRIGKLKNFHEQKVGACARISVSCLESLSENDLMLLFCELFELFRSFKMAKKGRIVIRISPSLFHRRGGNLLASSQTSF